MSVTQGGSSLLSQLSIKEAEMSRAHPQPVPAELARSWWALALRGLVAVLFGLAALFWPGLVLAALILLFGVYALVDGVLGIIAAFSSSREGMTRWVLLTEGGIGILFGIVALVWPDLTALGLLYIIAFWAVLAGIARILRAILLRREIENEWSMALSGILSVILGIVLLFLPGTALLAYAWLIGLFALALGVMLIVYAFRVRRQRRTGSRGVA
jgi:uncharacterized membrane protein HdeD (DUF308 family)